MLANIFLNIMEISIFTSVLIIIVMLCSKIISKKYQVGWRKVIWLLIAIRMLIPFNITLSVIPVFQMHVSEMTSEGDVNTSDSDVEETVSKKEVIEGTEEAITNGDSESTEQISKVEVSEEDERQKSLEADGIDTTLVEKTNVFDFNFDTGKVTVLALIWVLVALGKLLFHIVQYDQCKRLLSKNSVPCKDIFVIQQMENAMIQYELSKVPLVYWTSKIRTPMLMGYGNTMLLLPQGLRSEIRTDLEEIKLSLMIDHEI